MARQTSLDVTHAARPGTEAGKARARLQENAPDLGQSEMMAILDCWPHDGAIHAALIGLDALPEPVVARLVALTSPELYERLVGRHPQPPAPRREALKSRRSRPSWWHQALSRPF